MSSHPEHGPKLIDAGRLTALGEHHRAAGRRVVLCHGCFDIVHPGHLRYLQFARRQGDVLVVSITGDDAIEKSDGLRPYVPQELRAESLAALECVDHVVVADGPTAEPIIAGLRPDVYVKGKEYEHSTHAGFLRERGLVESLGGSVVFSSGEVVYSSTAILGSLGELGGESLERERLAACCGRWGLDAASLGERITGGFVGKRIAVVGDAILDRYTVCDAADVASEAPILSLRPLEEASYLGGAAIIAAHLRAMGAAAELFTPVANDHASAELLAELERQNVPTTALPTRAALPTKQRYLVEAQKLVKIDRGEAQPLDSAAQRQFVAALLERAGELDGVIFADFGYGAVTAALLEELVPRLRGRVGVMAGDVSGVRRNLLAMRGFDLLTPTERELRGALGDFEQSLPTVAHRLMSELGVGNLIVTMGRRGCVTFRPREEERGAWFRSRLRSEHVPALSGGGAAVDPVGAGDAMLAAAVLMRCTGATLAQAAYVGSAAAAIAVRRLGNQPVTRGDLIKWLGARPELRRSGAPAVG